ncbi:MAG: NosD domain-containing protein, partial [Candidatus Hodarchaeota archaeon]
MSRKKIGTRMKSKRGRNACLPVLGACIGLLCAALVLGVSSNHAGVRVEQPAGRLGGSTIHPTIDIDGNLALLAFPNKTGTGTATDPIIIENLEIDAGGSPMKHGIEISNTDLHLVIRNCTLTGAAGMGSEAGICLYNCTNVIVTGCTIYENDIGISVLSSHGNKIFQNNVTFSSSVNVNLGSSSNNSIWGNNVTGDLGTLGIYCSSGTGNTIAGNLFSGLIDGIQLNAPGGNTVVLNLVFNNTDNGIQYWTASTGNVITDNWLWNNPSGDIYEFSVGNSTDFPDNHFEAYPYTFNDLLDNDTDGDLVSNRWEFILGTDPLVPIVEDTDGDNIVDGAELFFGTNPLLNDTDGDGTSDFIEINELDSDGDGLSD